MTGPLLDRGIDNETLEMMLIDRETRHDDSKTPEAQDTAGK